MYVSCMVLNEIAIFYIYDDESGSQRYIKMPRVDFDQIISFL